MTLTNHWGKWIDSEIPVPGVISQNRLNWEYIDDEICLDCKDIYEDIHKEQQECSCDGEGCDLCEHLVDELDNVECFDHVKIIGDWKKGEDGQYTPDENGEFAAVLSSSTFNDCTVVWSKFIKKNVALCSPCAPGQASIESHGEYSCYDLPEYLKYKEEGE
jgi:hypothetical protein